MNIALIGYGKMGKEIEAIALSRGHHITSRVDSKLTIENGEIFPYFASAIAAI